MQIITETPVKPFRLQTYELNEIARLLEMPDEIKLILSSVNELADENEHDVRPDIVHMLEAVRIMAREDIPQSEAVRRFIEWTIWPCSGFYNHHLINGGSTPRYVSRYPA